jgi:hypothetical protein
LYARLVKIAVVSAAGPQAKQLARQMLALHQTGLTTAKQALTDSDIEEVPFLFDELYLTPKQHPFHRTAAGVLGCMNE